MGLRAHFCFVFNSARCASTGEGGAWPASPAALKQRPVPVPGDRGLGVLHAARERARWTNWRLSHFRRFAVVASHRQIVPPVTRQTRCRAAESPKAQNPRILEEVIAAARTPRQSLPVGQLGGTASAESPLLKRCGRLRCAAAPEEVRAAPAPFGPPSSPHGAPIPR